MSKYLDGSSSQKSRNKYQLEIAPTLGEHILTVVDENGETITRNFKVLE